MSTSHNSAPIPGFTKPGDFVVGSFDLQGKRIGKGTVMGAEHEVTDLTKRMLTHAKLQGGSISPTIKTKANLPAKKKAGRPKKESKPVPPPTTVDEGNTPSDSTTSYYTTESPKKFNVVFVSGLGKIKVKVLGVLEAGNAYALVFESEDDITFEPKSGEELELILDEKVTESQKVFYPGFLFTWLDGKQY